MESNTEYNGSGKRVFISVFIASILFINLGSHMAWTSPILPKLKDILTDDQSSWMTSMLSIGTIVSPFLNSLLLKLVGRKGTLNTVGFIYLLSWIVLACSYNFYVMCLGRILCGVATGCAYFTISIYATEVADTKRRGMLGAFSMFFIACGFLIEYCIGPYVSYLAITIISAAPLIFFFPLFYFLPETPQHYLLKGDKVAAEQSLQWYRKGTPLDVVKQELTLIENGINDEMNAKNQGNFFEIMRSSKAARKGLLLSILVLVVPQLTGYNAVISYTQLIFEQTKVSLSAAVSSMFVGLSLFIFGCLSPFLVRRFGTRTIYMVSSLGSTISLGVLCLFFYLEKFKYDLSKVSFLPLLFLIIYTAFYSWGLGSIAFTVATEFFPPTAKATFSLIAGVVCIGVSFIIVKCFAVIMVDYGIAVVFLTLFIFSVTSSTAVIVFLPNTSNLSLEQIQELLETGVRPKQINFQSGTSEKSLAF